MRYMTDEELGKCPKCEKQLREGFNRFIWCLCGYKDTSQEDPELNKRDHGLLSRVF